jgi:hypothetical protein
MSFDELAFVRMECKRLTKELEPQPPELIYVDESTKNLVFSNGKWGFIGTPYGLKEYPEQVYDCWKAMRLMGTVTPIRFD